MEVVLSYSDHMLVEASILVFGTMINRMVLLSSQECLRTEESFVAAPLLLATVQAEVLRGPFVGSGSVKRG